MLVQMRAMPLLAAGASRAVRVAIGAALFATMLSAGSAQAVEPDEILGDPVLESRARKLSTELRCLVCQNQSIDDSNAPLARDLRVIVREQLTAGRTDAEVMDFVVQRFGEFVLLRPRFTATTLLLWLAPLLLLLGGAAGIVAWSRRQNVSVDAPLSGAEQERLDALLKCQATGVAPNRLNKS